MTIGDSKSQLQNKEKAWTVLKSRLYQIELDKQQAEQTTATVTVEVWTLPCDSVDGILCTLWTPDSRFILLYTLSPDILTVTFFTHQISVSCSSIISVLRHCFCA